MGMPRTFVSTNGGLAAILRISNEIDGYPIDINDSGEVLITARDERSYLYIPGDGFKFIGDTNFKTEMFDINNLGDIVGYRDMIDEREWPVNNYGVVIGLAYNYRVVTHGNKYQPISLIWMD